MYTTKFAIPVVLLGLLTAGCTQQPVAPVAATADPVPAPVYGRTAVPAPVEVAPRRVVTREPEYIEEAPQRAPVAKGRSKKASVAIVAGSAGAGAAIGALAGGGKGAAIGALAGGAGGLIFDRATAKKKKPAQQ